MNTNKHAKDFNHISKVMLYFKYFSNFKMTLCLELTNAFMQFVKVDIKTYGQYIKEKLNVACKIKSAKKLMNNFLAKEILLYKP